MKLYDAKGKFWFNWATWKDDTYPAVNGTWQDYAWWKDRWVGAASYEHGDKGGFWYLGLNPGEPWSNAAKFTSGEDVKQFGPEFEVARVVAAARPGDTIHIVKYAPGGTALADPWDLTDSWKGYGAYAAMKQWVACARAAKPGAKVAGFFWLQGESDAIKPAYAAAYEANLTELIKKVRKDFDAPELPVIIGRIHPGHPDRNYGVVWGGTKKGIDTVRAAQKKVAEAEANAAWIETSDLKLLTKEWIQKKGKDRKTFNDGVLVDLMDKEKFLAPVHFDADGIRTIGKRMAAAWLERYGKNMPAKKSGTAEAGGRKYYFSSKGNDEANGSAPERAWRTLDRLRGVDLLPGDEVILAEGEEFQGGISLPATVGGSATKPLVIRGSGPRRATILADETGGIQATCGGIEIRDLILKGGPAVEEKKPVAGIAFYTDNTSGKREGAIRIERVDVSGFSGAGISIGAWEDSQPGYEDVRISNVRARDNGGVGITLFGKRDPKQAVYAHRRVTIRDCQVEKNRSGSGLVVGGVENGVIEFCVAAENTGKSGGVGMWAYDSKKVTFRNCIAYGTRTEGKDGGGFDLDGGCIDCSVERCLAYDNTGPGFMHCDYPKAGRTRGNVIRSSLSINDGRKGKDAGIGFGLVAWGAGLDDCRVENCLASVTTDALKGSSDGLLFVRYLTGFADKSDKTDIRGGVFSDCIAVTTEAGIPVVSNRFPKATLANVRFERNAYRASKDGAVFLEGEQRLVGLDNWRKATGQETRDGKATARDATKVVAVPADYRLTDPRALPRFKLFEALTGK